MVYRAGGSSGKFAKSHWELQQGNSRLDAHCPANVNGQDHPQLPGSYRDAGEQPIALRQLHPDEKQADRVRKLSRGNSDNVEISSALLCHFDIHLTHNNFGASLAISTPGCPEDSDIFAWQFVARRRWTITNNNSIIFGAIPITDSRRDRECASGCERNQSSGAAEDFPAGGRGRDDLRSAGGRSLRPRHTKAVCVHCWILSTFSNAHIYILLSHRLAEMRYWPRANICQQQTKTFRGYYTALARVVPPRRHIL